MTESGIPPLLTVSRSRAGATTVLAATGEIDTASAPQLRIALEEVASNPAAPVIDLSGVAFMASAGLTVLLAEAARVSPQRLRVVASPQVRRPLEVTGLHRVMALFDSLEAALRDAPHGHLTGPADRAPRPAPPR